MYLENHDKDEIIEQSEERTSIVAKGMKYLELFRRDVCCWQWALRRHWILLIAFPILGALLFFTVRTLTTSPAYMSRCSLIKQEPVDARFRDYPVGVITPPKLDAVFNIILSRQCLSETLKRLNLKWTVNEFFKKISLDQASKNSNYLFLAVTTHNPQLSAEAANTLAEVFIEHYKKFLRDYGKEPFENLERSNRELTAELENLQAELKVLMETNKIGFLESERHMIEQRILFTEEQNQKANADVEILAIKLQELEKHLLSTPEKTELYSERSTTREQALTTMRVELAELLQSYTENNPLVIRKKAIVNDLEKSMLENKDDGKDKVVIGKNPEYTEIKTEISKMSAEYKALKNHTAQRAQNLDTLMKRRDQLSRMAPAYTSLQDRIENKKNLLQQKELQARELEMFRERHFTDINIYEHAVPSSQPVGRARIVLTILGFIFGLMVALLYVFGREALDLTIRTKGDLESALNIPLLGVIPKLNTSHRADFYNALQEIIDTVDKEKEINTDGKGILALAIIEDNARPYEKVLEELLHMIIVKDISYLRIKEAPDDGCDSALLINDYLYGLIDELPNPGADNTLYFKLDDMAFFSPPDTERLYSIATLSHRTLVVWELFSYQKYPQFYARICSTAAMTVLPFQFGITSKKYVRPILDFLRQNEVHSLFGVIYAIDDKHYQEVNVS